MPGKAASRLNGDSAALGPWARAALLCMAVPLAFALGDWLWRSGLAAAWDELSVHTLLQQAREGLALPLGFGRGELHLRWISWGLDLGLGPVGLRLPILLGLAAEAALLWRLAKRYGGEPAAFGAVAVHALSRLTFLRLWSVLGFSLFPLWVLLAFTLVLELSGTWLALAGGLLSGLLLADYDAGPAALPALGLLLLGRAVGGRGREALALGLGLGMGLLVPLGLGQWEHWAAVRGAALKASSLPWWSEGLSNLSAFFFGGPKPVQSLGHLSAFAPWALPLLLLGLASLDLPLLLLLFCGLLPLAAPAPAFTEAHRAAVAWPVLCVAAGAGFAWLWRLAQARGRTAWAGAALAVLLAFGAWQAGSSFLAARRAQENDAFDYSLRLLKAVHAAQGAVGAGRSSGLLTELNYRSMAAARLLAPAIATAESSRAEPAAARDASGPAWVLLSGEQVGPLLGGGHTAAAAARQGAWRPVLMPHSLQPLWLLRPAPGTEALWLSRSRTQAARIAELDPLGWPEQLRRVEAALRAGEPDPFLRSNLIDRCLLAVDALQAWPPSLLALVAASPGLSARQCLAVAQALRGSDVAAARRFAERAVALDPSRLGARLLLADLKAARP